MNIQGKFVFNDRLISPLNGYVCKRITKQNIKFFGFSSVEELKLELPFFPMICKDLYEKQSNYLKKANKIRCKNLYNLKSKKILNKCKQCKNPIKAKFGKLFCSKTCSAKNSNKTQARRVMWEKKFIDKNIRCFNCNSCLKFEERRSKYCGSCKDINNINDKKSIQKNKRKCRGCSNEAPFRKIYCGNCKTTIRHYRSLCEFRFNVYDFPEKFDLYLVDKYGWYSPNGAFNRNKSVNLSGVSRDHLYSVFDGYREGRDPKIISHPANCRIMMHNGPNGNNSKKNKSVITWEDLICRINEWDESIE